MKIIKKIVINLLLLVGIQGTQFCMFKGSARLGLSIVRCAKDMAIYKKSMIQQRLDNYIERDIRHVSCRAWKVFGCCMALYAMNAELENKAVITHKSPKEIQEANKKFEETWSKVVTKQDELRLCHYVRDVDPELYEVFLKIKKDMGITEPIDFLMYKDEQYLAYARYNKDFNSIKIAHDFSKHLKPDQLFILVHELEHHRQSHGYLGSYHNHERDLDRYSRKQSWLEWFTFDFNDFLNRMAKAKLAQEQGADATAAGYFDCQKCLGIAAMIRDESDTVIQEGSGDFRTKDGYFSLQDFTPYLQRAGQEGRLCKAHRKYFWQSAKLADYLPVS